MVNIAMIENGEQKYEQWLEYLNQNISTSTPGFAVRVYNEVKAHGSWDEWLPITEHLDGGVVSLAWSAWGRYFEVEVYSDGLIEWFFRDSEEGVTLGSDGREVPYSCGFYEAVSCMGCE